MIIDRYTKVLLTLIVVCLIWISMSRMPGAQAQTDRPRFAISAAGGEFFLRAYRIDVYTGEMDICSLEKGCKPIPGSRVK